MKTLMTNCVPGKQIQAYENKYNISTDELQQLLSNIHPPQEWVENDRNFIRHVCNTPYIYNIIYLLQ